MKRKQAYPVFKPYQQNQPNLIPLDLNEMVPDDHLVRVVDSAIERLNIEPLLKQYRGGGTSSYHPRMMLKVIVYAYIEHIYSSRRIAKALRENIHFMWISGQNRPDFRTINRFRGVVMGKAVRHVFTEVVKLLSEGGYVKLENYFLDGTKLEADANQYSGVWAKNTKRYKHKVDEKIAALLDEIDRINEAEEAEYGDKDLEEMGGNGSLTSEKIEKTVEKLNQQLKEQPDNRKLRQAVKKLERDYLPRQRKFERQEQILQGRNSYSKTDQDAILMRMKENPQGNPKPGYNLQAGTENQFIVGYSLHQTAADAICLRPHLEEVKSSLGRLPQNVIADAAYGNEENYVYLEQEKIGNYVKYGLFHQEKTRKFKSNPYRIENLPYDPEHNAFTCPAGNRMEWVQIKPDRTKTGFQQDVHIYRAQGCGKCPLKPQCTKAKGDRDISVNWNYWIYKAQARQNLESEAGKKLRARRSVEVESVFGQIKRNMGFRRFHLRGLEKVKTEMGILAIAHNIAKMAAR